MNGQPMAPDNGELMPPDNGDLMDSLRVLGSQEQPRFNVKHFGVHASLGTHHAPGSMEPLYAKIQDLLQRQHNELLVELAKRDQLIVERIADLSERSLHQSNKAHAVLSEARSSEARPTYASETTALGTLVSSCHSTRFSTKEASVIELDDLEDSQMIVDFPRRSDPHAVVSPLDNAVVSTLSHATMRNMAMDLEDEDQRRKEEALEAGRQIEDDMPFEDEELEEALAHVHSPWKRRILKLVASSQFELLFAILIISNSVLIGVQVDWVSRHPGEANPVVFYVLQQFYAFVFLVELLMRLAAEGRHFFCSATSWHWNFLDFFLVSASIFEGITELMAELGSGGDSDVQNASNLRIIRVVRIARVMRILRVLRVVRFVRGLRTLVFSILCTLKSLVWAMILLLMVIYVFGILFTQAITDFLTDEHAIDLGTPDSQASSQHILRYYYGSLTISMYTLFEAVSGGLSWGVQTRALGEVGILCNFVFTVYIAFVYFAVLNVVTGVFCHAAIESAARDQEMVVQQQLANKHQYIRKVRKLFEDIDSDLSGTITLAEFESHFQDESVQAYFTSLDLDPNDAWTLFKLLDLDRTHQVDVEQFALGCLRLRGPATRIDIEKLIYDNQRMLRSLSAFSSLVEHQLGIIIDETARISRSKNLTGAKIAAFNGCLEEIRDLANAASLGGLADMNEVPQKRTPRGHNGKRRADGGRTSRNSHSSGSTQTSITRSQNLS